MKPKSKTVPKRIKKNVGVKAEDALKSQSNLQLINRLSKLEREVIPIIGLYLSLSHKDRDYNQGSLQFNYRKIHQLLRIARKTKLKKIKLFRGRIVQIKAIRKQE